MKRWDIIFKGIKEFWNTPNQLFILKLLLLIVIIGIALPSMFIKGKLLGVATVGMGLFVFVLGVESKFKNGEGFPLIISSAIAIIFFAMLGYIFSHPLM